VLIFCWTRNYGILLWYLNWIVNRKKTMAFLWSYLSLKIIFGVIPLWKLSLELSLFENYLWSYLSLKIIFGVISLWKLSLELSLFENYLYFQRGITPKIIFKEGYNSNIDNFQRGITPKIIFIHKSFLSMKGIQK
jgi:hypothetical protein